MKKKLKNILLIDDNLATNYIHKIVIGEADIAQMIVDVQSAYEGIEYLQKMINGEYPKPDIIFLDINMPGMNGWEFLEKYDKLQIDQKAAIIVVMLTTSLNPDDKKMGDANPNVTEFRSKPLTIKDLEEILKKHFSDSL
jgi:CheY-like chemotaxis protein